MGEKIAIIIHPAQHENKTKCIFRLALFIHSKSLLVKASVYAGHKGAVNMLNSIIATLK